MTYTILIQMAMTAIQSVVMLIGSVWNASRSLRCDLMELCYIRLKIPTPSKVVDSFKNIKHVEYPSHHCQYSQFYFLTYLNLKSLRVGEKVRIWDHHLNKDSKQTFTLYRGINMLHKVLRHYT